MKQETLEKLRSFLRSKNKKVIEFTLQILLVYYKIRPGANVGGIEDVKLLTKFIPILEELKLYYDLQKHQLSPEEKIKVLEIGGTKSFVESTWYSVNFSYKKIPKNYEKDDANLGKFLGFACPSNDFASPEAFKAGRISFNVKEMNTKDTIITEVYHKGCKKSLEKVKEHYKKLISKANSKLEIYGLKFIGYTRDSKDKIVYF